MSVETSVRVPALIIASDNDPFVPAEQFRRPEIAGNPHVTVAITRDGGHCAFVEQSDGRYDGYWAEREVVRFATEAWRDAASTPSRIQDLSLPLRA